MMKGGNLTFLSTLSFQGVWQHPRKTKVHHLIPPELPVHKEHLSFALSGPFFTGEKKVHSLVN